MNTRVQVLISFRISVFVFFPCIHGRGIAGSYNRYIFSLLRNRHAIFHSGCIGLHSHQQKCSLFSTSLPVFVICVLFDNIHSDRWEVISHCDFDLHFPEISDGEHLFMCLLAICIFSLENVYSVLLPIFNWVVCFAKFLFLLVFTIVENKCLACIKSLEITKISEQNWNAKSTAEIFMVETDNFKWISKEVFF